MEKILLIGGAGYIGPVIADHLLRSGYHVTIYDNLMFNQCQSTVSLFLNDKFDFVYGEIQDTNSLGRLLKQSDKVVILAGLVGDPITKKFPKEASIINEKALHSLIDELNGKSIDQVIFISTCSNYGLMPEGELASETSDLKPLSLYATAKVKAERYILKKAKSVDYSATVLRFATAFGLAPRTRFDLTVNEFTRSMFLNEDLLVYDPDTWRPYCHVKDFAGLIEIVFKSSKELVDFQVFNAGSDKNNKTKRMLVNEILIKLPAGKVRFKDGGVDPRNYRVDFGKVSKALGFSAKYDISFGIDEIIKGMKANIFCDLSTRPDFYGNYNLLNYNKK